MKAKAISVSAAVLLLAALAVMSALAERQGYRDLLLATPSAVGARGQSPDGLEAFSEDGFLLTYEISQPSAAQAINSKHSVTLVGTNRSYADIMGYVTLDGGFFTKAAWDAKNKHAVLNEAAAFKMFGSNRITGQSLKLDGEPWLVAGVIQDNDAEHAKIYVPSSVSGGQPETLMLLTDDREKSEEYVKNALKSIGIHENNYDFINLSKSASAFGGRFSAALKTALLAAVLLAIFNAGCKLLQSLRFYRSLTREMYFRELLLHYRTDIIRTIAGTLFFIGGIAVMLALSLGILEACLTWREVTPVTGELLAGAFGGKLAWLRDYYWIDITLFAACIGAIAASFSLFLRRNTPNTEPG